MKLRDFFDEQPSEKDGTEIFLHNNECRTSTVATYYMDDWECSQCGDKIDITKFTHWIPIYKIIEGDSK